MVSSNISRSNLIINSQVKTTKLSFTIVVIMVMVRVLLPESSNLLPAGDFELFFKSFFCITLCVIAGVIGTSYLRDYF